MHIPSRGSHSHQAVPYTTTSPVAIGGAMCEEARAPEKKNRNEEKRHSRCSFGKHVDVYLAVSTCFNLYYTLLRSLPYPRCSGHSMDRSSPWLLCERSERSTTNLFEPAACSRLHHLFIGGMCVPTHFSAEHHSQLP